MTRVLSIAHRGEPVGHRENTVEAVRAALDAGADMVEIDVRLTADGAPVLLHDETLSRMWNLDARLAHLELARVQQLKGSAGERIPSLEEIALLAKETGSAMMVDLPEPQAGPVAHALLQRLGVLDAMLFAGATGPLRAHSRAARIALSWDRPELPAEALLDERRPEYFNPYFRLLTADIADQMHGRGMKVSVWTVDHQGDMAAALDQGADAVISNRITDLIGVIQRQEHR